MLAAAHAYSSAHPTRKVMAVGPVDVYRGFRATSSPGESPRRSWTRGQRHHPVLDALRDEGCRRRRHDLEASDPTRRRGLLAIDVAHGHPGARMPGVSDDLRQQLGPLVAFENLWAAKVVDALRPPTRVDRSIRIPACRGGRGRRKLTRPFRDRKERHGTSTYGSPHRRRRGNRHHGVRPLQRRQAARYDEQDAQQYQQRHATGAGG
jgi:hypothetical protein